jgi:2-dehydropantoate 2-reductase
MNRPQHYQNTRAKKTLKSNCLRPLTQVMLTDKFAAPVSAIGTAIGAAIGTAIGTTMRHIIYGAGAIGGSIGARLHLAGQDVVLIARGAHFDEVAEHGLRYRNPEQDQTLRIPVVNHPSDINFTANDVVFLTMKSQHTHDALMDLLPHAGTTMPVICCQNGVANERAALRHFSNVYAMVVMLPATHLNPGEILHYSTTPGGVLDCGRYPGGTDACIVEIASNLTEAGFIARPDDRAMRWKYAKLLQNLGNSIQALCPDNSAHIMAEARREALACYAAAGVDCANREESRAQYQGTSSGEIAGITRSGGSSWQSLARGTGDIETDFLNGEICYLGRLHGVPTPVNQTLQILANEAVRQGASTGSMTISEIESAITRNQQA